ncbi:MAG TPA: ABC transporter permease, partial [Actinomycetes bacterium]
MRAGEAFRVAVDALRANGLRSALTMLGVVIGVAAVVILVALGAGAKQEVEQQVEGLGSNIIIVVPGKFEFGSAPSVSRLTLEDVEVLGRVVGDVDRVAVSIASGETVGVGRREAFVTVNGVNESVPN